MIRFTETWRRRPGFLHERLAAEIQDQIARGQISLGTELPSVRGLSTSAAVSKVTATQALDQLIETGWAHRRDKAPAIARTPGAQRQHIAPVDLSEPQRGRRDFRLARVAAPVEEFLDALTKAQARLPRELLGGGRLPGGHPDLRRLIAKRFTSSGLPTTPEQVIVTNGAMGAFASIVDSHPGPTVVEDPTYHVALGILTSKRRRVIGWARTPVWDTESLRGLAQRTKPAIAYLVPDFHNPSGLLSSTEERQAVGDILGALMEMKAIVIDETFFDLDLRSAQTSFREPIPHFAALHPAMANIITVGGLSKIAWAGLRIGWARVPDPQQRALIAAASDVQPPPILDQLIAIELWPELARIVRRRIKRLQAQRAVMLENLVTHGLSTALPLGGLSAWVDLGAPIAGQLRDRVASKGWYISTGSMYSTGQPFDRFIRLPFTQEPETIAELFEVMGKELAHLRFANKRMS
jgi:DNA-binding transcriptional MocR family regulator